VFMREVFSIVDVGGRKSLTGIRKDLLWPLEALLMEGGFRGRVRAVLQANQEFLNRVQGRKTLRQLKSCLGDAFDDSVALLMADTILERADAAGLNAFMTLQDVLDALDVDVEGGGDEDSKKVGRFTSLLRARVHDFTSGEYALNPVNIILLVEMGVFKDGDFLKLKKLKDLRRIDFRPFSTQQSLEYLPKSAVELGEILKMEIFDDMWVLLFEQDSESIAHLDESEIRFRVCKIIVDHASSAVNNAYKEAFGESLAYPELEPFDGALPVLLLQMVNQMGWHYDFVDDDLETELLGMAHLLTLRVYKCVRNTQKITRGY
jgi:hypothetical protein